MREQWKSGMCNCLICTNRAVSVWNGFSHLYDQVLGQRWTYRRSIHTLHGIFTYNIPRGAVST